VTDTPLDLFKREFTSDKSTSALEFFLLEVKVTEWNQHVAAQKWRIRLFDDGAWIHSLRVPETCNAETALLVAIGRGFLDKDASISTIFENCPVALTIGQFANLTHVPLSSVGLEWQLYAVLPNGKRHVFLHDEPLITHFSWTQLKTMEFHVTPLTARNAPIVVEEEEELPQPMESSDEESEMVPAACEKEDEESFFHPYAVDAGMLLSKPRDTLRVCQKTVFMLLLNNSEKYDMPNLKVLKHGDHQIVRFDCVNEAVALNRGLLLWAAQHYRTGAPGARRPEEIGQALAYALDLPDFNADTINQFITHVNEKMKIDDAGLRPTQIRGYLQQLSKFSRVIPTIANKRARVE
jgi:hypothetical protein